MSMIRKARISDAKAIHRLIRAWASRGRLLERPLNDIFENIRDFWVCLQGSRVVACCALHVVGWQKLGEIKSLAIAEKHQGKGIGRELVKRCVAEAASLGISNIFALTFVPAFFKKIGFKKISRKELPHKIWSDCLNCTYFPDCKEEAVMLKR